MKPVGKIEAPALFAITLGPLVTFFGYTIAAMFFPGHDGTGQTIWHSWLWQRKQNR